MITTITPLRRVAVTLVLTGATAFGAVGIAPAAFADETTTVTEQAPSPRRRARGRRPGRRPRAPVVDPGPRSSRPRPPVVEPAPAPAPVVTPPPVVIGKDGKPVKQPKVCTDKDQKEYAEKLAKANQQAAPLLKAAAQLRDGGQRPARPGREAHAGSGRASSGARRASATWPPSKLEAQAQAIITKVGGIGCIVVSAPAAASDRRTTRHHRRRRPGSPGAPPSAFSPRARPGRRRTSTGSRPARRPGRSRRRCRSRRTAGRCRRPTSSAQRSARPNSPSPRASSQPTGPA